jgi:NADH-quinone oxidoreductase subunit G
MDATCECNKCSGKAVLWMVGNEIARVTGRKDENGEVTEFICNECRFDKKDLSQWKVEGPRKIERSSVISAGHYEQTAPEHTPLLNKA